MVSKTLGVVIGRFQVPELHSGHKTVVNEAADNHNELLIIVGDSPKLRDTHDPLPSFAMDWVLELQYPSAIIEHVADQPSNERWSAEVDNRIEKVCQQLQCTNAVIYGGRDSFIPSYKGRYQTKTVYSLSNESGRLIRQKVGFEKSHEFLRGLIFAQKLRVPLSYQAVDIAVLRQDNMILAGRKDIDGEFYRLPGGFVDPGDSSLEAAARRELTEEVGLIEVTAPSYFKSFRINDYRYRSSPDKVMTALFSCEFLWGAPKAADDLQHVEWVPFRAELFHPTHRQMVQELVDAKSYPSN